MSLTWGMFEEAMKSRRRGNGRVFEAQDEIKRGRGRRLQARQAESAKQKLPPEPECDWRRLCADAANSDDEK